MDFFFDNIIIICWSLCYLVSGEPDSQAGTTCDYKNDDGLSVGYCQKRSEEATITVDIINRNDAPVATYGLPIL